MGNELRADDAVGLHVVRLLKPCSSPRLKVFEGQMTPEVFIGPSCAAHPSHVLIIDSAELGEDPGTWRLLQTETVEQGLFTTHAIPAVEVAAEIKRRCGSKVVFIGIQPKSREIALGLSKECRKAATDISEIIRHILS